MSVNEQAMPLGDVFVVSSEKGRGEEKERVGLPGIKTAPSRTKKKEDWSQKRMFVSKQRNCLLNHQV